MGGRTSRRLLVAGCADKVNRGAERMNRIDHIGDYVTRRPSATLRVDGPHAANCGMNVATDCGRGRTKWPNTPSFPVRDRAADGECDAEFPRRTGRQADHNVIAQDAAAGRDVRSCATQMKCMDVRTARELMQVDGPHPGELRSGARLKATQAVRSQHGH